MVTGKEPVEFVMISRTTLQAIYTKTQVHTGLEIYCVNVSSAAGLYGY